MTTLEKAGEPQPQDQQPMPQDTPSEPMNNTPADNTHDTTTAQEVPTNGT
jgi:hypothetical protein